MRKGQLGAVGSFNLRVCFLTVKLVVIVLTNKQYVNWGHHNFYVGYLLR